MTTVDDRHPAPPVTDTEPVQGAPIRRRRRLVWAVLGVLFIAAVGAGGWMWVSGASAEPAPVATGPAETAVVELGTIAVADSWDGTLDHGTAFTVTSGGEGIVTWLADQGEIVGRGDELFRVDEQPVTLLYGVVPMYRDLGSGDSGIDVEQLETNLAELGYDGFTVDDEYTGYTSQAVRTWQKDIGAEQTGTATRREVVFVAEGGQVDALRVGVGDVVSPGTPVLDITGTDQVVSLEVDIDDRNRFEVGTAVTVLLPGGDEVAGTVSATAVVEVVAEGPDGDTESILEAEVALAETAPAEFVGAAVEVVVAVDERRDVLVVPVNALLALSEGGYGLEVVAGDGTISIVPVSTGLFAEGKVEVDSADIAEGTVVGVAGR